MHLPDPKDFDPTGCDLDAQRALQNFGGLTLDEALVKFRENPLGYQEDFMFMGPVAFAFYYPVIEQHLKGDLEADPYDDHQAWILAHCIKAHFGENPSDSLRILIPRILELASFVLSHIQRFGMTDANQQRVAKAWAALTNHLHAIIPSTGKSEQSLAAESR